MTTSSKLNFRSCQPKHILTNRTVNLFQDRALPSVGFLIVFFSFLIASADTIKLSADSLIVRTLFCCVLFDGYHLRSISSQPRAAKIKNSIYKNNLFSITFLRFVRPVGPVRNSLPRIFTKRANTHEYDKEIREHSPLS